MKQLLLILALLSSATAFGQSQKDYEHAMAQYQRYYNKGNGDSIIYMFSDAIGVEYKQQRLADLKKNKFHQSYGRMRSWKYEGVDTSEGGGTMETAVRIFLITCDSSTHVMSFHLDKNNQFETFRPMTFTDYINSKFSKYFKGEGKESYKKYYPAAAKK